ncbi:hypothetical protein FOA52_014995 [Chlamydomonas sp. UWO 241]|nr:hypothetical protein FOA52_014995 [Chlamydomonas sp. UWO 241]
MFILFRETIEASIVVSVLLTFLNSTAPSLKSQVWWGVACGVCLSLILAMTFAILYYVFQSNVFQGKNQMIFNGVIFWVAAIFITFLAFAMMRFEGWEAKWKRKIGAKQYKEAVKDRAIQEGDDEAVTMVELDHLEKPYGEDVAPDHQSMSSSGKGEKGGAKLKSKIREAGLAAWPKTKSCCTRFWPACFRETFDCMKKTVLCGCDGFRHGTYDDVLPGELPPIWTRVAVWSGKTTSYYAMFLLVFFTILREGVEAIVFLFGVGNTSPESIPISGAVGIILGLILGFFIYYTGRTIKDIKWLLFFFAVILFFIAAGATANGANLLMIAGMFGTYYVPAYPEVQLGVGSLSSNMYGGEGQPPAPSAADLLAGGFNDGDEGPMIVVVTTDDGYQYQLTTSQPWYERHLWDICECCSDQDTANYFLALMNTLFGYRCAPAFIHVIFYLGYWFIVLAMGIYKYYKGTLLNADYKHTNMMKKLAKEKEGEEVYNKGALMERLEVAEAAVAAAGGASNEKAAIAAAVAPLPPLTEGKLFPLSEPSSSIELQLSGRASINSAPATGCRSGSSGSRSEGEATPGIQAIHPAPADAVQGAAGAALTARSAGGRAPARAASTSPQASLEQRPSSCSEVEHA